MRIFRYKWLRVVMTLAALGVWLEDVVIGATTRLLTYVDKSLDELESE